MSVEVSWKEVEADGVQRRHYSITPSYGFVIPNGQTGANVTPVTLPANCRVLGVVVYTAGIAAATNISAEIAFDTAPTSAMATLYEQDDPGTQWSQGAIPTSGVFAFILTHAFRARRIRFILSNAASGSDVTMVVYGFDGII